RNSIHSVYQHVYATTLARYPQPARDGAHAVPGCTRPYPDIRANMEQTRPRPEAGNPLERQLQSVIPADQWGMTPCWGQVPRKGEHMPWARPEGPGGRCTPGHQTRNAC